MKATRMACSAPSYGAGRRELDHPREYPAFQSRPLQTVAELPDYDGLKMKRAASKTNPSPTFPTDATVKSSMRTHGGHVFVTNTARRCLPLRSGRLPLARRKNGRQREEHHL